MKKKISQIIAYTDGGSRGNPGPAAAGFVLKDQTGLQLKAAAFFLGRATNNVAEYTAVIKALEAAKEFTPQKFTLFSDSELLVRQINGQYRVKSENIKPLFAKATALLAEFDNWQLIHITRDKNCHADDRVNQALDLKRDIEIATASSPAKKEKPLRLGILISGGGRTMINILENIKKGQLNAEIALVISSRSTVAGVERAKSANLPIKIIRKKDYPDTAKFSKHITEELTAANVELVIQAGWLCLWKIPARYKNRVMNIHPALLPGFGGKGMWGHNVHKAVIKAGCKTSGCTVHFCNDEYDTGPIIIQRTCPVEQDDSPETLAERVFEQECIAYPEAIKLFSHKKLTVTDGKVEIR